MATTVARKQGRTLNITLSGTPGNLTRLDLEGQDLATLRIRPRSNDIKVVANAAGSLSDGGAIGAEPYMTLTADVTEYVPVAGCSTVWLASATASVVVEVTYFEGV